MISDIMDHGSVKIICQKSQSLRSWPCQKGRPWERKKVLGPGADKSLEVMLKDGGRSWLCCLISWSCVIGMWEVFWSNTKSVQTKWSLSQITMIWWKRKKTLVLELKLMISCKLINWNCQVHEFGDNNDFWKTIPKKTNFT